MVDFPIDDSPRDGWGAWIDHYPGPCPLRIGDVFQAILRLEHWENAVMPRPSVATRSTLSFDVWGNDADAKTAVIKYRLLIPNKKAISFWNRDAAEQKKALAKFCRTPLLERI